MFVVWIGSRGEGLHSRQHPEHCAVWAVSCEKVFNIIYVSPFHPHIK